MRTAIRGEDLRRFADTIAHRLGLRTREQDDPMLRDVLTARAADAGLTTADYVDWLADSAGMEELGALATRLANGETYFFRDAAQFQVLAAVVIPELVRRRGPDHPIQVLSAGCSSGEEAYSLAITLRETLPDPSWARVVGVDVNPVALDRAARGRYSPWALRATPEHTLRRWFRPEGAATAIDEGIRAAVRFERRNLVEEVAGPPVPGGYDVIFCRNVLMYFGLQVASRVLAHITSVMAPDGYLFVSSAENLRQLSDDFEVRHGQGAFYYQRVPGRAARRPTTAAAAAPRPLAGPVASPPPTGGSPLDPSGSAAWCAVIKAALERTRALSDAVRMATSPPPPVAAMPSAGMPPTVAPGQASRPGRPPGVGPDLAVPLDMLRRDLYQDALTILAGLPAEAADDPDALVLRAVLLAHSGQLAEAEDVCGRLLVADPDNSAAHFVLGTCHAGRGDNHQAVLHYRAAGQRDPRFSMPHLHLGLLACRRGDFDRAQEELRRALSLLPLEDAARVLLFGGGFSRSALIELCRAELEICGRRGR